MICIRSTSLFLVSWGLVAGLAAPARAEIVKPRFVLLIDNSGSMAENAAGVRTHGDGSKAHPGCDLDNNGKYDDSKLFQAKAALDDTIAAFGNAEFALARYHQEELGQTCAGQNSCAALQQGANICENGRCAYNIPTNGSDYKECEGGTATGNGCVRCANPMDMATSVFYYGGVCCPASGTLSGGFGLAGDVVVPFPVGTPNQNDLFMWMDGVEDFPVGTNKELRASATTPIGGALNAVRDWLVNDASPVGSGSGLINHDDKVGCRSYNVILVTDGIETQSCVNSCKIGAARAAENLYHACTNGGIWDPIDLHCVLNGSSDGTSEVRVKTYVVGFTVNDPSLNSIAASGGTGTALLANNQAELTARLSDIIAGSIPAEKCDCQDNTCDGQVDETFPQKGQVCTVGVGRCKRQGTYGCKADGSGVVCSTTPSGICPATDIQVGTPVTEQCGAAPGCQAPTPEDCADDNCDGQIDENMSCACSAKPEICNGLDDDCNNIVDDVPSVPCGLNIGECKPGTTSCADDGAGGEENHLPGWYLADAGTV